MRNIYENQRIKARAAIINNDYSGYNFGFNLISYEDKGLNKEDVETIMVLVTVAQIFKVEDIKTELAGEIEHDCVKSWIIDDVLVEADTTFFDDNRIGRVIKSINKISESVLVEIFKDILGKLNY